MSTGVNLRHKVIEGGLFLAARQGFAVVLGLVGVLLMTREIGTAAYGTYASALGVFAFIQGVAQLGISVYVLRQREHAEREVLGTAAFTVAASGALFAALAFLGAPLFARFTRTEALDGVTRAMVAMLPLTLVAQIAGAALERELAYRKVASIDLAGQLTFYAVGLPLAFAGWGVWAPTVGWLVQQGVVSGLQLGFAAKRFGGIWNPRLAAEMASYGLGYSSSIWVWQLRNLVNPLVVGRFAGADTVGVVALTIRIVESLSFVKSATWRLSLAVLARVQDDGSRLLRAVSEGIRLQVLALGPLLLTFALVGGPLFQSFFGERWNGVAHVYPFVALSYLVNAMFNLHSSALYVRKHNADVTAFHVVHVILFGASAVLLVPRLGLLGYGVAELVAIPSYVLVHWRLRVRVGAPGYGIAVLWSAVFSVAFFVDRLGPLALGGLVVVAAMPATWREVAKLFRTASGLRTNRGSVLTS